MQLFAVQKNFCLKKHQSGKIKKNQNNVYLDELKANGKRLSLKLEQSLQEENETTG